MSDFSSNIRYHKAIKQYVCGLCGRPIMPGDLYMYHFGVDGGETFTEREHVWCFNVQAHRCHKCQQENGWNEECWETQCFNDAIKESGCVHCDRNGNCTEKQFKCDRAHELLKQYHGEVEP